MPTNFGQNERVRLSISNQLGFIPEKFTSCNLCLFTVAFRHHVFYLSLQKKYLSRRIPLLQMAVLILT